MQPWLFVARPGSTASAECEQAVDSYPERHRDNEHNCQPTYSRCQLDFKDQLGIANLKPSSLFYVGHKHLQLGIKLGYARKVRIGVCPPV